MTWKEDITERVELSIIELIGIFSFVILLVLTENINYSFYPMIFIVGLIGLLSYFFKSEYVFKKMIKLP